ncbi:MAG TPA: YciI family protein [Actinomycetota bacterium]|nr:YciI family protein [Actinomycetota bacterium]
MNIQTCHVVEATYAEGAAEKRAPYREEHLQRVAKLVDAGAVVVAGALADMSASLLILAIEGEDAVRAVIESDIYWENGIWTDYTVRKLNRVTP